MAEDCIPEILAEQRLGHKVPGMRGLYAHASDRMRDDLKAALQARHSRYVREWRLPRIPRSRFSTSCWRRSGHNLVANQWPGGSDDTALDTQGPGETGDSEKMISQILPEQQQTPPQELGWGPASVPLTWLNTRIGGWS